MRWVRHHFHQLAQNVAPNISAKSHQLPDCPINSASSQLLFTAQPPACSIASFSMYVCVCEGGVRLGVSVCVRCAGGTGTCLFKTCLGLSPSRGSTRPLSHPPPFPSCVYPSHKPCARCVRSPRLLSVPPTRFKCPFRCLSPATRPPLSPTVRPPAHPCPWTVFH